jgi:hypothetical protein
MQDALLKDGSKLRKKSVPQTQHQRDFKDKTNPSGARKLFCYTTQPRWELCNNPELVRDPNIISTICVSIGPVYTVALSTCIWNRICVKCMYFQGQFTLSPVLHAYVWPVYTVALSACVRNNVFVAPMRPIYTVALSMCIEITYSWNACTSKANLHCRPFYVHTKSHTRNIYASIRPVYTVARSTCIWNHIFLKSV